MVSNIRAWRHFTSQCQVILDHQPIVDQILVDRAIDQVYGRLHEADPRGGIEREDAFGLILAIFYLERFGQSPAATSNMKGNNR